jgi:hypothetical protein
MNGMLVESLRQLKSKSLWRVDQLHTWNGTSIITTIEESAGQQTCYSFSDVNLTVEILMDNYCRSLVEKKNRNLQTNHPRVIFTSFYALNKAKYHKLFIHSLFQYSTALLIIQGNPIIVPYISFYSRLIF